MPVVNINVFISIAIAAIIVALLWSIGVSYNNPEKDWRVREWRVIKFKALAIVFAIYAASIVFLIIDKAR